LSFIVIGLGLCSCGKQPPPPNTKQDDAKMPSAALGRDKNSELSSRTPEVPPPPGSHVETIRTVRSDEEFKRTVHELLDLLHQGSQKSHSELIEATAKGDSKKFTALVKQGLDVNVSNQDGRTILMDAVEVEYLNFVRVLIQAGADVNAKDKDGKTALQIATAKNNGEIIQLLKEAGAK
jgi:uncharacterized protein